MKTEISSPAPVTAPLLPPVTARPVNPFAHLVGSVIVINGTAARVTVADGFGGTPHLGFTYRDASGNWLSGWAPSALCEVPDAPEADRLTRAFRI